MNTLVDQFVELFAGNNTAVGTQTGGVRRTDGGGWWFEGQIGKHLAGTDPCGVYPIRNSEVHWGCVDWDEGYDHSWADAINTHNILKAFDITTWIERSRSKGWHLWLFAQEWVPATTMRHALIAACELVNAPIKEVNPKQVSLKEGELGNYVRLPYPDGVMATGQAVVDMEYENEDVLFFLAAQEFSTRALEHRTPTHQLETLAARYTPPAPPASLNVDVPQSIELPRRITTKLDGVTWLLMNDGPLPDKVTGKLDRSAALFRLGRMLKDNPSIDSDEAWAVMCRADAIWGKYQLDDRPELLKRTLEKAWT